MNHASSSRRTFVKGMLAAASTAVLGFDPVRRTWVTSAYADSPILSIPGLQGALLTDPTTLATFADDFGHIVHHTPVAVLKPAVVQDVVLAVTFCNQNGIQVAMRGQGHSTAGQSQVQGGLVIDSSTLDAIEAIGKGYVQVQTGLTWKNLLATIVPLGLHPPVLTGFVGLSIGGTLSMGGIGAASFKNGAIVDNVLELQVVTGDGQLRTCSPVQNPVLFNAVLGGVGQYGIIVRAKIPTVSVAANARNYVIPYTDPAVFFADMNTLTSAGKIDGVYALLAPPGAPNNPAPVWVYVINAVKFFAPGSPPNDADILSGLNFPPPALQVTDTDTFTYDTAVDAQIAFLQSIGLIDVPHVWGDVFLPASQTQSFVQSSLADLSQADLGPAGFVLLFPIKNRFPTAPAFRLPCEQQVFLFDVLTSGLPTDPNYVSTELAKTRTRFENARAIGGTLYPIGSTPMSQTDWALQYGIEYPILKALKGVYDPNHILTPGPGIF